MIGYSIAVSIVAIMISIGGIILGLGYSFNNKKLKEFGQGELIQSLINGVIVGALFILFIPNGLISNSINGIVESSNVSATCQGYMSQNYAICFAYNYLVGSNPVKINGKQYPSLLVDSRNLLIPVSTVYATISVIGSLGINLLIATINFNYLLAPIIKETGLLIRAIITAIIGIYVQAVLLNMVSVIAIPILLPVGIILRTFYPTRKMGGAIMAISIGLFAVFPMTYILDAQMTAYFMGIVSNVTLTTPFTIGLSNLESDISSISLGNATSTNSITRLLYTETTNVLTTFYDWAKNIIDMFALLVIEVFFLPLLSLILTVISIRELASILGSEISFGKFDIF